MVESNWRRLQGHLLQKQDLAGILACKPAVLVVGTGNMGVMKVPDLLREELSTLGIELIAEKTGKAVDIYDQMQGREDVVAAFHLTC